MKKPVKVSAIECIAALLLSSIFSLLGVGAAVLINILFSFIGNFLCGIKYVGFVFELIGDLISDSFIGTLITFATCCIVGFAAGAGYQKAFGIKAEGKNIKLEITEFICFLIGMAATFLAQLLLYTYDAYTAMDGSLTFIEAFKLSPELYVYSEYFHVIIMIAYRVLILFINSFVGFGVASHFLELSPDD